MPTSKNEVLRNGANRFVSLILTADPTGSMERYDNDAEYHATVYIAATLAAQATIHAVDTMSRVVESATAAAQHLNNEEDCWYSCALINCRADSHDRCDCGAQQLIDALAAVGVRVPCNHAHEYAVIPDAAHDRCPMCDDDGNLKVTEKETADATPK